MKKKFFPGTLFKDSHFIASTATPDRMGDIIEQSGWVLDNYKKNPVILWQHRSSEPIGRANNIQVTERGLEVQIEFMPEDVNPTAARIEKMVKEGFLNAVSVGFDPIEYTERDTDSWSYHFTKQELLEISIVTVPANAEALVVARSFDPNPEDFLQPVNSSISPRRKNLLGLRKKQLFNLGLRGVGR